MKEAWTRRDIPYDAMGDYSDFPFDEEEKPECEDQDRTQAPKQDE